MTSHAKVNALYRYQPSHVRKLMLTILTTSLLTYATDSSVDKTPSLLTTSCNNEKKTVLNRDNERMTDNKIVRQRLNKTITGQCVAQYIKYTLLSTALMFGGAVVGVLSYDDLLEHQKQDFKAELLTKGLFGKVRLALEVVLFGKY